MISASSNSCLSGASRNGDGIEAVVPASFVQEEMWLQQRLWPDYAGDSLTPVILVEGCRDEHSLELAWRRIVQRHESLRTTFREVNGALQQVIAKDPAASLPVEDVSGLAGGEQERVVAVRIQAWRQHSFHLETGPLCRARLLKIGPARHVLMIALHHAVIDLWSLSTVLREMATLYGMAVSGQEVVLPPASAQFRDYACWERACETEIERQLPWWREQLRDVPTLLDLPMARRRRPGRSIQRTYELPRSAYEPIPAFAREARTTPFVVGLAAFAALLRRYTGRDALVVGTVSEMRLRRETRDVVGLCAKPLPLPVRLRAHATFRELVADMNLVVRGALSRQMVPLRHIIEAIQPERHSGANPLFQVAFTVGNLSFTPQRLTQSGLTLTPLEYHLEFLPAVDLNFFLAPEEDHYHLFVKYNEELFEREAIDRLVDHYHRLLADAVRRPDQAVDGLNLLSKREIRQQLVDWNQPAADPELPRVHELFENQVDRTPNAIAVEDSREKLLYRQLDERANQLAWELLRRGVTRDQPVAVHLDRSCDLVAALLGVMKAGACYVPLDPNYPGERLRYILETSGARVMVSEGSAPAWVGDTVRLCRVRGHENARKDRPPVQVPAQCSAYTIFTSGSTGRPKGVAVPHAAVANFSRSILREPGITSGDVVLAVTTFSFDISVLELLVSLQAGARVVIASTEATRDPTLLKTLLETSDPTLMQATPATWQMLIESGWTGKSHLKVLCGGEALPLSLANKLASNNASVWNMYGPTETTIWSSVDRVQPDSPVCLGRGIDNTRLYVLDEHLQLRPVGVPGELYIGGSGVTRGYVGQPGMTAERFLPDPFSTKPGERMYRTGDRARWNTAGRLEFEGRTDHQIKLRGFRIELGEIEALLEAHPDVDRAVVVLSESGQQLIAYYAGAGADSSELERHVREQLPNYMVPSRFMHLAEMPLTPAGKVDRKRLPAPDGVARPGVHAEPRPGVQQKVAEIWSEIFDIARVGATDNFFQLGGHSLLAVRFASSVRAEFGVELPVRVVFERPVLADLAAWIEAEARPAEFPPITRIERSNRLPASFGQERMWVLWKLLPGSAAYHMHALYRLEGDLRVTALKTALNRLVERHEILRTGLAETADGLTQIIYPPSAVPVPVRDLSSLPAELRESEALRRGEEEGARRFALDLGEVFRVGLWKLSERDHFLLLAIHHVVGDDASAAVLIREMAVLYEAELRGAVPEFQEIPFQYADYAAWQRAILAGSRLTDQLAYWKNQLAGLPALRLPTDRPRPPAEDDRGDLHRFEVPHELVQRVQSIAQSLNATEYMVLMAAFSALLSRYSGQDDFAIGCPIAGRHHSGLERLVGFLVNTLTIRIDLSGRPNFRQLVERVRARMLEAYEHQDAPFEKVVERCAPDRATNVPLLFQVMLLFQNTAPIVLELPNLSLSEGSPEHLPTQYDLALMVRPVGGAYDCLLSYRSALFEPPTMVNFCRRFVRFLDELTAQPGEWFGRPELRDEKPQLGPGRRGASTEAGACEALLHQQVEAQVDRTPDAVAIRFEGRDLRYRELDTLANAVAEQLMERGAKVGELVGVQMERSFELVIAILGVLKAGCGYVPIDPTYPLCRRQFVARDAGLRYVLVGANDKEPGFPATPLVVCVEGHGVMRRPRLKIPGAAPAYVIYTSGSTGVAKGVVIPHRAIQNRMAWIQSAIPLSPDDAVLHKTPCTFDVSISEIFWPLMAGARVVMARPDDHRDSRYLAELIQSERVTIADFVPSMLAALLDDPITPRCESLRVVISGGEELTWSLRTRLFQVLPRVEFYNMYGPTEASIDVAYDRCDPAGTDGRVPIGRPVANTRLYVLDDDMRPVPTGIAGELYVGGLQLASGYLSRPALTAECFVPDAFGAEAGGRLYRTGDRVLWANDGRLEFLGRSDRQVKLRGFRIELGDIESRLEKMEGVNRAIVALDKEVGLVGYVVGAGFDPAKLREALGVVLPEYMVPSAIVPLKELPLTPNGKVDFRALPRPGSGVAGCSIHVEPRTEIERALAEIWGRLFHHEKIGAEDHFFDLGGHSLMAIRMIGEVRRVLGVEVPLRLIFERSRLSDLARFVEREAGAAELPPVERRRLSGPQPASAEQQGLLSNRQLTPDSPAYHYQVLLKVEGDLDVNAVGHALSALAQRHEVLRTRFVESGRAFLQVVEAARAAPLRVHDLCNEPDPDSEARRQAAAEVRRPFALEEGEVWKVHLWRTGDSKHLVLFVTHHVASDGWSMQVLVREFVELYEAIRTGRASRLSPLAFQYRDYAAWQADLLSGDSLRQQLHYWMEQLRGVRPLALPTDYPRPPIVSDAGAYYEFELPTKLLDQMRKFALAAGATDYMVTLAAFAATLSQWTGQKDITIGCPIAGRRQPELGALIGNFVNTLVLRVSLVGDPTFRELLEQVRRITLGAYTHQDVPLETMALECQPDGDSSPTPLFQAMLAFQSQGLPELKLEGLEIQSEIPAEVWARYDLLFNVVPARESFACSFTYRSALWNASTIETLADQFVRFLGDFVSEPDHSLSGTKTLQPPPSHASPRGLPPPTEERPRQPGTKIRTASIAGGMAHVRVYDEERPATEPLLWPSVGDYGVYDDVIYYIMTHDDPRNRRYLEAIRRLAPGAVALDIGAGRDLNWARACLEAGARKAYAIERLPESFRAAQALLKELRLEGRITLLLGDSVDVALPERVDLCVSELIGTIGSSEGVSALLRDAQRRFLKPGGHMIPSRCLTRIAAVELPSPFREEAAFEQPQVDYLEQVLLKEGHPFDLRLCVKNMEPSWLLSAPATFEDLNFRGEIVTESSFSETLNIQRPGRCDGFAAWIRLWCIDGQSPCDSFNELTSWLPVFFPIFWPGIELAASDTIDLTCEVRLSSKDGVTPDYRLHGTIHHAGGDRRFTYRSPRYDRTFRALPFYEHLFSTP